MTTYFDTSVVIAMLAREPRSAAVEAWFDRNPVGSAAASPWVEAEVSSALSLKRRTAALSYQAESVARIEWSRLLTRVFVDVPIERSDFVSAAELCARPDLTLRASDGLHLAVARRVGMTLATFDVELAKAAGLVGVSVASIE